MPPNRPNNNQSTDGFVPPSGASGPINSPQANQPTNQPIIDPNLRPVEANNLNTPPASNTTSQPGSVNNTQPEPEPHVTLSGTPFAEQDQHNSRKKSKKREELMNTVLTVMLFILAPLFAVFMIIFVFQSYVVDGSSMYPTLHNGDRVFILKLPKTLANFKGQEWVPTRNEVIVFKKPGNEGTQLIKRVIGLPGDKVVIKDGSVRVYNLDHPEGINPEKDTPYEGTLEQYSFEQDMESNVGEGELFVLGDNRTPGGSLDSHSGLGLVPIDNIVGRLWIRYFPLSSFDVYAITPRPSIKQVLTP